MTIPSNLADLLQSVISTAQQASHAIMRIYNQESIEVSIKKDSSPVTEADLEAHRIIVEKLSALEQQWPVLSEEECNIAYSERQTWDTYWLVDPLDGTRDFVKRTDCFSVNIALIHDHQPVLGVIDIPVRKECFYACRDHGAYKQTLHQAEQRLQCRRMTDQTPVLAVSGHRRSQVLGDFRDQLGEHDIMYLGSSIKSCEVAEGKADVYPCLGPTSEWDTAAAQCIVEQAGGRLVNLQNQPLRYNTKESLTNDWFFVCGDPDYDWISYLPEIHHSR